MSRAPQIADGLHALSASAALRRLRARELSSSAYVAACLARIAAREPRVRAFSWLDAAQALDDARARDREARRDPRLLQRALHGIPIAVKDAIDVAGMPTRHGSPLFRRAPAAQRDADCVALLRAAGAVLLGKTHTLEFAAGGHYPPTRNPHDPAHTPGGSSSGSAAAVADAMVPLALGTQTGGSTIRPAAFCGTWALKPSFGSVSLEGVKHYAPQLDTVGLFARSAEDLARLAHALGIVRMPSYGRAPSLRSLRIGLCRTALWAQAERDAQAALLAAARRLASRGVEVVSVRLPRAFASINAAHEVLMRGEGAVGFRAIDALHPRRLARDLRELATNAAGFTPARMRAAEDYVAARRVEFESLFEDIDALLMLAAPGEAPRSLRTQGLALFNRMGSALHVPCIAIPAARGQRGLPIGLQIKRPRFEDARLLAIAAALGRVLEPPRATTARRSAASA